MIRAFNMTSLKDLTLWNCPSCLQIRDKLPGRLNLKTFELVIGTECLETHLGMSEDGARGGAVVDLLQTFDGLEDLFLMLSPPPTDWHLVGQGILHHALTLERLVTHERGTNPNTEDDADGEVPWRPLGDTLHRSTKLSCLGVAISIRQLVRPHATNDPSRRPDDVQANACPDRNPGSKGFHSLRASSYYISDDR